MMKVVVQVVLAQRTKRGTEAGIVRHFPPLIHGDALAHDALIGAVPAEVLGHVFRPCIGHEAKDMPDLVHDEGFEHAVGLFASVALVHGVRRDDTPKVAYGGAVAHPVIPQGVAGDADVIVGLVLLPQLVHHQGQRGTTIEVAARGYI